MNRVLNQAGGNPCRGSLARHLILLAVLVSLAFLASPWTPAAAQPARLAVVPEEGSRAQRQEGWLAKAVYYAPRYQGRRTSSGELYDPKKLTAAHPTLPLGTRLRVIHLKNNRSVVVTVNDRCAKRSFEIIDCSMAAAQALGFVGRGTAQVRLIPIEP